MPDLNTTPCYLCGVKGRLEVLYRARDRHASAPAEFPVVRCGACGLGMTWPVGVPAAELTTFYPRGYWGGEGETDPAELRRAQAERIEWLERFRRGGRILDVGCGAALFLRALDPARWERHGVEISEEGAAAARRAGIPVVTGEIPDLEGAARFDAVTFWDCLEHLSDPRAHLAAARRLLAVDGVLVLSLPNFASAQVARFGPHWFALDAPRHRFHFTLETLSRLLKESGFRVLDHTDVSEIHNAHSYKESLKAELAARRGPTLGRLAYLLYKPWVRALDARSARQGGGATLTVTAAPTPTEV